MFTKKMWIFLKLSIDSRYFFTPFKGKEDYACFIKKRIMKKMSLEIKAPPSTR